MWIEDVACELMWEVEVVQKRFAVEAAKKAKKQQEKNRTKQNKEIEAAWSC